MENVEHMEEVLMNAGVPSYRCVYLCLLVICTLSQQRLLSVPSPGQVQLTIAPKAAAARQALFGAWRETGGTGSGQHQKIQLTRYRILGVPIFRGCHRRVAGKPR